MFRFATPSLIVAMSAALPAQQFVSSTAPLPTLPLGVLGYQPNAGAAADFDGDGDRDLLVAVSAQLTEIYLLRNDGTGRFERDSSPVARTNAFGIHSMAVGDLDGDGDPDAIFASENLVLFNDGAGGFTASSSSIRPASAEQAPIALADVDGDGDLDFIAPRRSNVDRVYLNNGAGEFLTAPIHLNETAQFTTQVVPGDIDGDGDLDLVSVGTRSAQPTLNPDGLVQVQRNDGSGNFSNVTATSVPAGLTVTSTGAALADFDADGDLDLFISENRLDHLFVNDGTGVFSAAPGAIPARVEIDNNFSQIATVDIEGDGDLDVMIGGSSRVRLLVNDGTAHFMDVHAAPSQPVAGWISVFAVEDFDDDGDLDAVMLRPNFFGPTFDEYWINNRRHIEVSSAPTVGARFVLEIFDRQPTTRTNRVALPFVAQGRARIPIAPFGVFGLAPGSVAQLASIPLPAGQTSAPVGISVPARPELIGQRFAFQALIVEPSISDSRLTNTIEFEIQ